MRCDPRSCGARATGEPGRGARRAKCAISRLARAAPRSLTRLESHHPGRRLRKPPFGGNHPAAQADGGDRRAADPVAHHEAVRRPWSDRLHRLRRLQGLHDQGVFRQPAAARRRRDRRSSEGRGRLSRRPPRALAGDAGRHGRGDDDRRAPEAHPPVAGCGRALLHDVWRRPRRHRRDRARGLPQGARASGHHHRGRAARPLWRARPRRRRSGAAVCGKAAGRPLADQRRLLRARAEGAGPHRRRRDAVRGRAAGEPGARRRARRLPPRGVLGGDGHVARPQSPGSAVGLWPSALGDVGAGSLKRADAGFWRGRRVLVTGHTGFKGGWLALRLAALGAEATGLALDPPTNPSLFALAGVGEALGDRRGDIRDAGAMTAAIAAARPQVVFHLAAQPLVRAGLAEPIGTLETNVMGTALVLEALRGAGAAAIVVVTSDKVYRNDERGHAFAEDDPLGGADPYSGSKSAAEMVARLYRESFGLPVATARAGNVVGGGDFAADRLLPDVWRARAAGAPLVLRRPAATRPWGHVLDVIEGYLLFAEALAAGDAQIGRA